MANIYWVGGAGTWNTTSTANWANTSGGTGGTGTVPTAADNVFFDSGNNSGWVFSNVPVGPTTVFIGTGITIQRGVVFS